MDVNCFNLLYITRRVWIALVMVSFSLQPVYCITADKQHPVSGYSEEAVPGSIVFRLKQGHEGFVIPDGTGTYKINHVDEPVRYRSIKRVFPQHMPPEKRFHPTGEKMVDLSMVYEMKVAGNQYIDEAIHRLLLSGMVEYAEPRYIPRLLIEPHDDQPPRYIPNDSLLYRLWYLDNISAYEAWGVARGDTGVFVAIVDTGNDFFHPDLVESVRFNDDDPVNGEDSDGDGYIDNFFGWDLGEDNNYPQYHKHGHGVHVSGTSSATADNRLGIAGTGFHARYMPVKVDDEFGRLVKAYEGIVYAADQGASVINCSWGGHFGGGKFGEDIVRYATLNRDALVVAGAGNAANSLPFYPASYEFALGVTATDSLDQLWEKSSFGLFVDLSAPGVRIMSTWPDTMYILSSGTSMSSPMVAGAAAIVRSHFPELSAIQTKARLQSTADLIDTIAANSNFAGLTGAGRLNMYRALTDPFSPWMRIAGHHATGEKYGAYRPGETMIIILDFQNLLAPSESISAKLISLSRHASVIHEFSELGPVASLQTVNNNHDPFRVIISAETPLNQTIPFFVEFFENDSVPAGRQAFTMVVNQDYSNIDAGHLQTTITSKGAIGFNYPNYAQGNGLIANRGFTVIKCAGLVFGSTTERVSDNIYGPAGMPFSTSFVPLSNTIADPSPTYADIEIGGRFNDSGAGNLAFGIEVDFRSYFWKEPPGNRFFITEYLLTNARNRAPAMIHTGFFADWFSRNGISMKARYDEDIQLAFVNTDDGTYAGLQLLTSEPVNHYAFDNDGENGSINIRDGFDTEEKFLAMTSRRMEAGIFRPENDVSSMLSTGPHHLRHGHSMKLVVAMHVADNLEELRRSAREAINVHRIIETGSVVSTGQQPIVRQTCPKVYPNPFSSHLTVQLCHEAVSESVISLVNGQGYLVKLLRTNGGSLPFLHIETGHLPPGTYFLLVRDDRATIPFKLLKF